MPILGSNFQEVFLCFTVECQCLLLSALVAGTPLQLSPNSASSLISTTTSADCITPLAWFEPRRERDYIDVTFESGTPILADVMVKHAFKIARC